MPDTQVIDNTDLKVLIQKRGQVKSKLTRFKTYIDSINLSDRTIESVTQLKLRFTKLEECWIEFDNLQSNIELIDNSELQLEEREQFEGLYFSLSAQAQIYIDSSGEPGLTNQPTSFTNLRGQQSGLSLHSYGNNQLGINLPQVKLPTISLPSFSGNYEDWLSFSDSFQSLIDNNETLSDIQKLHYLKSSLKDEASQVIKSIELTSDNYSVAWELLETRYKNLTIIIQRYTKALFDLPSVRQDSALCLRQLLDGFLSNLRALKALKQPTEHWDTLLIHLITSKLNENTYRDWEMLRPNHPDIGPSLTDLVDFIQKRCHILEIRDSNNKQTKRPENTSSNSKPVKTSCFISNDISCHYCEGNHAIFQCQALIKATPTERSQKLKSAGLCFNCLKPGHKSTQCQAGNCRKCNGKHNTLLHLNRNANSGRPTSESTHSKPKDNNPKLDSCQTDKPEAQQLTHSCTSTTSKNSYHILLSTAQVEVVGSNGSVMRCRALIDSGSQSCLVTERVVQHLRLAKKTEPGLQISGIDKSVININGTTKAQIKSHVSTYKKTLQFLIVSKITGDLPSTPIDISNFKIPNNIILSDPNFHRKGQIDLLLGQEIFFDLLCIGQVKIPEGPTLQKTKLGWIVGGKLELTDSLNTPIHCNLTTTEKIDKQLQTFWMLEEPNKIQTHLTLEEKSCEEHFAVNTKRAEDGRYIVKMPLKSNACDELGDSRDVAIKRFLQVEKRLEKDKVLRAEYNKFMKEYETLGHMKKIGNLNDDLNLNKEDYFLPHHPVINSHSTTTKMRVVFDASAKTTSGKSLNDVQLKGPKIQRDIFSILLGFRMHNYVLTADIEKMYRQILVEESQRELQKIIWRSSPNELIQIYKLNTVTYGTSSAPYLATRTLKQLAMDESQNYPKATKILQRDFYVDDLITGCASIDEARELQTHLIELLKKGGFNLRKWNANSEHLTHLPQDLLNLKPQEMFDDQDSTSKTLGLWWDSKKDEFQFKYTPTLRKNTNKITKRTILSDISKLYDPLGFLSPIIVRSKMFLQEMWKLNLTWDESLPIQLHTSWNQFMNCLQHLTNVRVPRQLTLRSSSGTYEIHGFADSSEKAYGAVVYLRHENNEGDIIVNLICSKSRIAPLRTTSLPRLELCAALLLAELVNNLEEALQVEVRSITYWTDSSVVLAWIKGESARWKTFVANRVAKIQSLTENQEWKHVSSEENPADLVSRGTRTTQLIESDLWWHGPCWLSNKKSNWPRSNPFEEDEVGNIPERKPSKIVCFLINQNENIVSRLLEQHSSLVKIKRILSWILRFIHNTQSERDLKMSNHLQIEELNVAEKLIIKHVQNEVFSEEMKSIENGSETLSSKITSLDPFIDESGLLRVGGRLKNASLSYDHKHQILLPKSHLLTELIVKEEHNRQLHCGPQTLLYTLRQKYWIINGREVVRKISKQCLRCFKAKPKLQEQKMCDLPANRINLIRPFLHCGVDYCGPFLTKSSKHRRATKNKCYVAVFICLATKAIHLELVSDLTTAAFLATLRRFVSRRGMCASIRSDNGKTFVGTNRHLNELKNFFDSENQNIIKATTNEGINWKFNSPYSPHTGGIWEAAIKSLKYHLVRVVGNASLNFEEFNTLLIQVEAVLNSRPLTPISNYPSDLTCLTPAHFLVGDVLTTIPEPCFTYTLENRLNRWQRIQQLYQHFWNRWSKEYLNHLQTRNKWKQSSPSLKIGDLVLLKEDHVPPINWPLGRVTAVYPGKDNLVRTVAVRTPQNVVTRTVHRLCLLPAQD